MPGLREGEKWHIFMFTFGLARNFFNFCECFKTGAIWF